MSDQPLFGEWYIRVEALGQIEETQFLVEEYYQTRYEVCNLGFLINLVPGYCGFKNIFSGITTSAIIS